MFGIATSRILRHNYESRLAKALGQLRLQPLPTVALDIDGVLADQVPHVLSRAEQEMNVTMTKSQITALNTKVGKIPFRYLILDYLKCPKTLFSQCL